MLWLTHVEGEIHAFRTKNILEIFFTALCVWEVLGSLGGKFWNVTDKHDQYHI